MGTKRPATAASNPTNATADALDGADHRALAELIHRTYRSAHVALAATDAALAAGARRRGLSVPRAELRGRWFGRQGSAAMNTVTDTTGIDTVSDGLTVSMVEVDAAAARAALADRLQLAQVDLEHPAVVAVLAAVVAAGWRPPVSPRGSGILTHQVDAVPPLPLFGDSDGITEPEWSAPPGRPR